MVKITQKTLAYEETHIDGDEVQVGKINLFRDYSAVNRKGLSATTKKGVPLVMKVAITATAGKVDQSQSGGSTADLAYTTTHDTTVSGSDPKVDSPRNILQIRMYGCSNGWVTRNAAVKTHAAREAMFRKSLISKKERGAYDHTIRYMLSPGSSESYMTPQSKAGDLAMGTWDHSRLIWNDDTGGALLSVTGSHATEESTTTFTSLNIQQMYLHSRDAEIPADSNIESDDVPAKFSVLNRIFTPDTTGVQDDVVALARDEQDNPPYDLTIVGNDLSEQHELGRLQFGMFNGASATTVVEVPFGLLNVQAQVLGADEDSTGNLNAVVDYNVKLLAVYPMEG